MQEIFLGEAIKRRRLELGLTQEQLCEGICEPITISRLENGRQTPSRNRIQALLERLNLPADRYFALLSKNEIELESLKKQIVSSNLRFLHAPESEKAEIRTRNLTSLQKLEATAKDDDKLTRQFILRTKILLGKDEGSYSLEEQRAMLTEAIHLTSPNIDMEEIGRGVYTSEEIKIINQYAVLHIVAGEHMDAIGILRQLYNYICKHAKEMPLTRAHFNMVAFNYARELDTVGQYEKAVEVAEVGRQSCLEYGNYLSLPGLLSVIAESYHFLGEEEKSKKLYHQAYYLCEIIGDNENLEVLRADAKKYLNLEFAY